jgi:hypothetical protein
MNQFYLSNMGATVVAMLCGLFTIVGFVVARGCPDIPVPWSSLLYMTFVVVYPLVAALSLVSLVAIVYIQSDPTGGKPDCDAIEKVPLRFAGGFAAHVVKTALSLTSFVGGVIYLVYACCCEPEGNAGARVPAAAGRYDEPPTKAHEALTDDEIVCKNASRWNVFFGVISLVTFFVAAFSPAPLLSSHNPNLYGVAGPVQTFAANETLYLELRYKTAYGCSTTKCADIDDLSAVAPKLNEHLRRSKLVYYAAAGAQVIAWFLNMDNAIVVSARKSAISPLAYGSALAAFVIQLAALVLICVAGGFIGAAQDTNEEALTSAGPLEFAVGSAVVVMSGVGLLINVLFSLIAFIARRSARRAAKDGMDAGLLEERPRNVRYM